jgi:hypothetical protein
MEDEVTSEAVFWAVYLAVAVLAVVAGILAVVWAYRELVRPYREAKARLNASRESLDE